MGGVFGGDRDDDAEDEERAQLAQEKATRTQKARDLMLRRLQSLRRRRGGGGAAIGGGNGAAADQQDLLGG